MTPLNHLARAVLLFRRSGTWNGQDRCEWIFLTGEEEASIQVLCNLAKRLVAEEMAGSYPTNPGVGP